MGGGFIMAGTAGSVAPVFRSEGYVATNIYDFYHAIIHNNKLYFCRQDGTVGHEPTGITDEYWFLSLDGNFGDAKKLGGETAAQWQAKIDVEKERIDQIVAMGEGTGGNVESEVLDMRIGADGITYESAGTAVREQISSINRDLSKSHTLTAVNTIFIQENEDLNTYLTEGNYKITSGELAKTILNLPLATAGRITVMSTSMVGRYKQIFESNSLKSKVFERFYDGKTWHDWQEIANIDDIKNISFVLEAINADTIPENADFDNYTTQGNYKVATVAIAKTISNIPDRLSGRLTVISTTESTYLIQKFETNSSTPRIYVRTYMKGTWNAWFRMVLNSEFEELKSNTLKSSNVLITASNYTDYFTDYNDIPINSVYNINYGVPLLNSPHGNETLNQEGDTLEYPNGTVFTISGNSDADKVRGRMQIFTGSHPSTEQSYMCFRNAYTNNNVLYWSEWQKFSESYAVTSSNIVIRKATAHKFFTDLNDAPINSIYQIDLDCDEGTLLNHPNPGQSCVLITFGFSHVSRHGMVQQCFGLGGDTKMFFRYGYLNSTDDYRWTPWKRVLTE